jgi:hypothetical protein
MGNLAVGRAARVLGIDGRGRALRLITAMNAVRLECKRIWAVRSSRAAQVRAAGLCAARHGPNGWVGKAARSAGLTCGDAWIRMAWRGRIAGQENKPIEWTSYRTVALARVIVGLLVELGTVRISE